MNDIVAERTENILSVQLNRPAKKNAMTSSMYITMAELLDRAGNDDQIHVVLWHAAGDSFSAGNDLEDFMNNPLASGESPQARLIKTLIDFDKPLVAAVQGAAIGGGTTMLAHCDFVYAGGSTKLQLPFVNLALVPEFGSSYLLPLRFGYVRAAELILLGRPFDAQEAAEIGLVTEVVHDERILETAVETSQALAKKPTGAVQACKRLLRRASREELEQAVKFENEEFAARVRSDDAKEAFRAFFAKRQPAHVAQ
jgi:enoyl-CoA hydratase/carnithine racemase